MCDYNPFSQNNNKAQFWAIRSSNCYHSGSRLSTEERESSRMQSACDEGTHRADCNYKGTRIEKRRFSVFLGRCPQSSPSLASNYAVWLVSVLSLHQRRKTRERLAPNRKREIFLGRYRSQQDATKAPGVFAFFPLCSLPLSSFLFSPL